MAQKFVLRSAEEVRKTVTNDMQKRIRRMYEELYDDISKEVAKLSNIDYQKQNLILIQKQIKTRMLQLNNDIKNGIVSDMYKASNEVVYDMRSFLKQCGFKDNEVHNAFQRVPIDVVESIVGGSVYQKDWSLSGAIWGYNKKVQDALTKIISIGTQKGKSSVDIAKDLESYVKPGARKGARTITSWRYDNFGNKIVDKVYFGNVDYNALRLARTMVSHSYEQSIINTNKNNPFVEGYKWITSNFHGRVCEICEERAETDQYGLGVGVFPKDELPLDHPNGMCTFEVVLVDDMEGIADRIAGWYNSPLGTYKDIDKYSEEFI